MIAAALLLAASAPVAPPVALQDEIVVTAKVNRIRMTLGRTPEGKAFCRLDQSSGDRAIDDATCREAAKCVKKKPMTGAQMDACLAKRKRAIIRQWSKKASA